MIGIAVASTVSLDLDIVISSTFDDLGHLFCVFGISDGSGDHREFQVVARNSSVEKKVTLKCKVVGVIAHRAEQAVVNQCAMGDTHSESVNRSVCQEN